MSGSNKTWAETRSVRLTNRIRGYLDRKRLPYVIEREDGAIVLQLKQKHFITARG